MIAALVAMAVFYAVRTTEPSAPVMAFSRPQVSREHFLSLTNGMTQGMVKADVIARFSIMPRYACSFSNENEIRYVWEQHGIATSCPTSFMFTAQFGTNDQLQNWTVSHVFISVVD